MREDLDIRTAWGRRCWGKRIKHALETPFEWLGIALLLSLVVCLPRRALFVLCDGISGLMYFFDRSGKRRSLENLHIILGRCRGLEGTTSYNPDTGPYSPTPAEARIIRRSYRNMARTVGYACWTLCHAKRRCAATGEMSSTAHAFMAANRPAVTVSGHIGCWEILSQLALLEGHGMMSVAKNIGTRGMTWLLMKARCSIGQEIVPAKGAFKPLMAGIRAGKSIGLLVDQKVDTEEGGVWVRFLGKLMPVSAAPAFFSAKAKAPIVVAWSRPLKDGRYRCETIATYPPEEARDVWKTTQSCAHDLERVIRHHPSCWVLNYNYFREKPSAADIAQLEERIKKAER